VIRLDAATVLLQWATGGLLFLWVTTRRREVGIGYGWLLRAIYIAMLTAATWIATITGEHLDRDFFAALAGFAAAIAFIVSVRRRKAGVAGERDRAARTAVRTGRATTIDARVDTEFPPLVDAVAPLFGTIGLVFAGLHSGGPHALAVVRTLVGAVFLGAVTDAMLLGHWYLVQPGLGRAPLLDLVRWTAWTWPFEVAAMLWPPGMVRVLEGRIDDGWNGTLGWFWVACAATTIVLCAVTRAALKERAYSAVMAATGLLYLAILTAFGTDLVARAILAS
jgi:hypothetical protein